MSNLSCRPVRILSLALLAWPVFLLAQNQTAPPGIQQHGGWRRADEPPTAPTPAPAPAETPADTADQSSTATPAEPGTPPPPAYQTEPRDQYGVPMRAGQQPTGGTAPMAPQPPQTPPPSQLTIKPGTYLTVRINQPLSSDHNQPGDAFSATLVRPVVVDGFVVAQSGQTLGGRVVDAKKAGHVEGVSHLGIQLTDLTLVDGQNMPIHSQLINRTGSTSVGRDVAAVGGTTALGAAVGAAADWGRGAAIGAGAGAAAGLIGVLLTRGHPTVIYPEQVLTFRVEEPVTVATDRAPQAFRYVEPEDYQQGLQASRPVGPRPPGGPYGYPPPPPYGGYPFYGAAVYPYYYSPGFSFFYGPRFYGPGLYFGHYGRYGRFRR